MSDARSHTRRRCNLGDVMVGHTVSQVVESRHPQFRERRRRRRLRRLADSARVERQGSAQARSIGADLHGDRRPRHAGDDGVRRAARHRSAEGRAKRWSCPRRRARSARSSVSSRRSRGAARSAIAGLRRQVPLRRRRARVRRVRRTTRPTISSPALRAACPDGIDIYFENVGGAGVRRGAAAAEHVRAHPAVRTDLEYNATQDPGGPNLRPLLVNRAMIRGLHRRAITTIAFPAFLAGRACRWCATGRIKYREDIVDGLGHRAGRASSACSRARTSARLLVRVSPD